MDSKQSVPIKSEASSASEEADLIKRLELVRGLGSSKAWDLIPNPLATVRFRYRDRCMEIQYELLPDVKQYEEQNGKVEMLFMIIAPSSLVLVEGATRLTGGLTSSLLIGDVSPGRVAVSLSLRDQHKTVLQEWTASFRLPANAATEKDREARRTRWKALSVALRLWCDECKIPSDHGWVHYTQVADHARYAQRNNKYAVDEEQYEAINLAALLHDVDDPKIASFVKMDSKELSDKEWLPARCTNCPPLVVCKCKTPNAAKYPYPIAAWWMRKHGVSERTVSLALEMISYVSASKNGDMVPEAAKKEPWKLIPRAADRLEAIGWNGIQRCHEVSMRIGNPLVTPSTPLPSTQEELKIVLSKYTLASYNGKSASMLDHFLEKLLLLECPLADNLYLATEWETRQDHMQTWLLNMNRALRMIQRSTPIPLSGELTRFK